MESTIVNRVAKSGLVTINPEQFKPQVDSYAVFDIKAFLYKEMILKEKEFRTALQQHQWKQYAQKAVAITCSNDALIPQWAPMLVASYLKPFTHKIYFSTEKELIKILFLNAVEQLLEEDYKDARIVIKGCGAKVPTEVYIALMNKLQGKAKSIMYGEPCSTVPIFKRK